MAHRIYEYSNHVNEEFSSSLQQLHDYVNIIKSIEANDSAPMWEFLKTEDNVNVYRLPVHHGSYNEQLHDKLPHMVKGVATIPKSLPEMFAHLQNMTFEQRKALDPLVTSFVTKEMEHKKAFNELCVCRCNFKPPTWFLAARDFVFLSQTYLFDNQGQEIPLPEDNEFLDDFVLANKDKIAKIIAVSRSVDEDEISRCRRSSEYTLAHGEVRGFIRCIAWVIDRIDDNSCRGQTLSEMDVAGYVPDWVKGIIAQHNASGLIKLKNHIEGNK
ncbi:hypothetical protein AKO1_015802 [Acrasis kona]|uniref:Uncharacterized protein n=1 Tax=Acrasis kona TaxID=1008807 RepID=A0AAW2ZF82_9EUKA